MHDALEFCTSSKYFERDAGAIRCGKPLKMSQPRIFATNFAAEDFDITHPITN
jgi:hypothetical protein